MYLKYRLWRVITENKHYFDTLTDNYEHLLGPRNQRSFVLSKLGVEKGGTMRNLLTVLFFAMGGGEAEGC